MLSAAHQSEKISSSLAYLHCHASAPNPSRIYRVKEQSRLLWCIAITAVAMVIEIIGGIWTGSLALLSDAGHMFSHLFSLAVSYGAILLATRKPDAIHSFGFYRSEILAALLNGLTLIIIVLGIFYVAYQRFLSPEPIATREMLFIAIFGLGVNLTTALILKSASQHDLNVRSAFIHMLGDTLSSVGVIVAAIVISYTNLLWLDPAVSILIALVIAVWSYRLISDAIHILLEATPKHINPEEVVQSLKEKIETISDVHHIHIWELTSHVCAMTAHVVVNEDVLLSQVEKTRQSVSDHLFKEFAISHTNLQFECQRRKVPAHF